MPPGLLSRLDAFATKRHISRSEAIRLAMVYALEHREVLRLNEKLALRETGYKMITAKMPPELVDKYEQLSEMYRISRSELIRRAIEAYLDENRVQRARIETIRL